MTPIVQHATVVNILQTFQESGTNSWWINRLKTPPLPGAELEAQITEYKISFCRVPWYLWSILMLFCKHLLSATIQMVKAFDLTQTNLQITQSRHHKSHHSSHSPLAYLMAMNGSTRLLLSLCKAGPCRDVRWNESLRHLPFYANYASLHKECHSGPQSTFSRYTCFKSYKQDSQQWWMSNHHQWISFFWVLCIGTLHYAYVCIKHSHRAWGNHALITTLVLLIQNLLTFIIRGPSRGCTSSEKACTEHIPEVKLWWLFRG